MLERARLSNIELKLSMVWAMGHPDLPCCLPDAPCGHFVERPVNIDQCAKLVLLNLAKRALGSQTKLFFWPALRDRMSASPAALAPACSY